MNPVLIFFIVYIIGYILTLFMLIKWGKKMGFDYSGPHHGWYDDYSDNKTAYTSISFFSWVFIFIMSIAGLWKCLTWLTGKFIKD